MSKQVWADAATQNCVWLLQKRYLPSGCYVCVYNDQDDPEYKLDPDTFSESDGWDTEAVFLTRREAFAAGANRIYNYGQYGKDWRIYGVPAVGLIVDRLQSSGVTQQLIDDENVVAEQERLEYESEDERCKYKPKYRTS